MEAETIDLTQSEGCANFDGRLISFHTGSLGASFQQAKSTIAFFVSLNY
jgi:hypothetical protein